VVCLWVTGCNVVSIHAPLARSDLPLRPCPHRNRAFQSTLPSRGATRIYHSQENANDSFNPRSPREERHKGFVRKAEATQVSIHAPLARSDTERMAVAAERQAFQSTLPSRGATSGSAPSGVSQSGFNPRSPREERRVSLNTLPASKPQFQSTLPSRGATWLPSRSLPPAASFNPRSPREERPSTMPPI